MQGRVLSSVCWLDSCWRLLYRVPFALSRERQVVVAHSGFLPTSIRTAVEVPGITPTGLPVFSEGEILEESTRFKAMAARICPAIWFSGRSLTDSSPFGV